MGIAEISLTGGVAFCGILSMLENESIPMTENSGETIILNPIVYKPCGDFIHIEAGEPDKVGLIHLPQGAKAVDFVQAKALAVGPECKWVKEGETILVAAQAIMRIKHDGRHAQFTKESSLISRL